MFDTHCHLNFKRFGNDAYAVVKRAKNRGVELMLVPGTDLASSEKAAELAGNFPGVYAAVGIHPHHLFEVAASSRIGETPALLGAVERMLVNPRVLAVGEVGIDRHQYSSTKYPDYRINGQFILLQRDVLAKQLNLAADHHKSLVLHNRESTGDMLEILSCNWRSELEGRTVFHCCEPEKKLLSFALQKNIYIGVDGDLTYDAKKQDFIKEVPIDRIVLETDSPYLLPEPLRSLKQFPNEPANLPLIAEAVSRLKGLALEDVCERTTRNAMRLFGLPEDK